MSSDVKRYTRRVFDEAEDYDRDVGFFATFGRHLVERSGVAPGDHVLDLACGRGASLVPVARSVGTAGRVIGVDLSPQMVRRSNEALAAAGLGDRAEAVVGDMEVLRFDEAAFDTVLCGFGVFFTADVTAMLDGVRRVLRPDGRFVFSVFAGLPLWPWLFELIAHHADVAQGGEHPMWTADGAGEQLRLAGFAEPTRHRVTETIVIPSFDALWTQLWSLGTRRVLESMDETSRTRLRTDIGERLLDHRVEGGFASTSSVWIITAGRGPGPS